MGPTPNVGHSDFEVGTAELAEHVEQAFRYLVGRLDKFDIDLEVVPRGDKPDCVRAQIHQVPAARIRVTGLRNTIRDLVDGRGRPVQACHGVEKSITVCLSTAYSRV